MGTAVFEISAALFGACIGSFLNAVIHRVPQEDPSQRSLLGRSRCPRCGGIIRWFDNVPVLSWLCLRARARCCGEPISPRYPLVELLTAALFFLLAVHPPFGAPILADGTVVAAAAVAFGLHMVFIALLIALTFIDFDTRLLPDVLTKPGIVLGVLGGLWPGVAGVISNDASVSHELRTTLASVIGLAVGGGVTWAVRAAGTAVFKKEAMGFGDVKLMAMIGAFLGWQGALLTLFLGCVFGAVVGGVVALRRGFGASIPFGPYLAMGALVVLFGRDVLVRTLFDDWPRWQRENPSSLLLVLTVSVLSLLALLWLIRRGRR
ncbi:MAG TPA: prepilin peptidase [bacterium]|nr:prepilin peptidase [bacterium]